ncbi:hypothetical protein QBC43DRAFT_15973 [Cladorrhinum sp. PSN259]|nr:hypothetical protein QBC43DRAFT_15973 [Cladorrhinum sp. PSN259]
MGWMCGCVMQRVGEGLGGKWEREHDRLVRITVEFRWRVFCWASKLFRFEGFPTAGMVRRCTQMHQMRQIHPKCSAADQSKVACLGATWASGEQVTSCGAPKQAVFDMQVCDSQARVAQQKGIEGRVEFERLVEFRVDGRKAVVACRCKRISVLYCVPTRISFWDVEVLRDRLGHNQMEAIDPSNNQLYGLTPVGCSQFRETNT